ncbi:MAG TPA: hypothetical protein VEH04_14835 [Verrucomicrobiae bacterium]|nr:hypothetical protein [Verrucomicrobiae bacterium]
MNPSYSVKRVLSPCSLVLLLLLLNASGQTYSINWHTIDGGGGTSTGGVYSVTGTIGQPDASPTPMSGGSYTINGGFWGNISVIQTPGAPFLSVLRTTTNTVVISWPSPSAGFVLQTNSNLGSTNWGNIPAVSDNGAIKFIIVNPPLGNRFFRLFRPL